MALSITAMTRERPAPCNHWRITITFNGTPHTRREVTQAELQTAVREGDLPWWAQCALLWLHGRLTSGFTIAQSTNVEIIG